MKKKDLFLDVPPPAAEFEGFPSEMFKFLHRLKKNNNKEWFDSHRSDYEEHLREPSKAFVEAMAVRVKDAGLPLKANVKSSLFRINRDVRFSKDKSPYKTHIGIVFPMEGLAQDEWTGMYLGMEPEGKGDMRIYVGGGAHEPSSPYLKRIREKLVDNYTSLEKLMRDKKFLKEFPSGITGASLIRAPKGFEEDHPGIKYLKMKEFMFGTNITKEELMNSKLLDKLIKKFSAGIEVLTFLGRT